MSLTLSLPAEYPWVILVGGLAGLVVEWQRFIVVGGARQRAGVPYPLAYAPADDKRPEAIAFNCAQRANQNMLEALPAFYFSLAFAGLKHPRLAAVFGTLFVVGRIFYTIGYATGVPKKRYSGLGGFSHIGAPGLLFTCLYAYGKLAYQSLF
ncbi:microsomal glutathione S-transferase 3 [Atractiella rhizophila]|nr:microsomal glutathione S-transferase 3 [Atractiella rhizophila]